MQFIQPGGRGSSKPTYIHYSFDLREGEKYDAAAAQIFSHFQYWSRANVRKKINICDGRSWQSSQDLKDNIRMHLDYLNEKEIKGAIKFLLENKILLKKKRIQTDEIKTAWYAFNDEDEWLGCNIIHVDTDY